MFTGIVEEIGTIQKINASKTSAQITIQAKRILEGLKIGDSISTNGVCLTATKFDSKSFVVDVMAETMRKSNLKNLKSGDPVNLERALQVGDRLGGHFVSGHIDGIGILSHFEKEENAIWITIETSPEVLRYIVYKGSIAIDGISLTVAEVGETYFRVSIIPHTKEITTLLSKNKGEEVNLECDMIGKYIERFIKPMEKLSPKKDISLEFLKENGFL